MMTTSNQRLSTNFNFFAVSWPSISIHVIGVYCKWPGLSTKDSYNPYASMKIFRKVSFDFVELLNGVAI